MKIIACKRQWERLPSSMLLTSHSCPFGFCVQPVTNLTHHYETCVLPRFSQRYHEGLCQMRTKISVWYISVIPIISWLPTFWAFTEFQLKKKGIACYTKGQTRTWVEFTRSAYQPCGLWTTQREDTAYVQKLMRTPHIWKTKPKPQSRGKKKSEEVWGWRDKRGQTL